MEGLRDLRAVYAERRAVALDVASDLEAAYRAIVEQVLAECDRRLTGDTGALADIGDVRTRISRLLADVLEGVLAALGARGHGAPGDAGWLDRRVDLWRILERAARPQRTARKLVASAIAHRDWLTVQMLSSPELALLLHTFAIDGRALQIAAVRILDAERERDGRAPVAGVTFCLAQETDAALHELASLARILVPTF